MNLTRSGKLTEHKHRTEVHAFTLKVRGVREVVYGFMVLLPPSELPNNVEHISTTNQRTEI